MTWIEAFLWTCALETPIYVVLLRRAFRDWWAPLVVSIFLQVATHPLFWRLFPREWNYWNAFFVGESVVVVVEGALVALLLLKLHEKHPIARGLAASFLANTFSAMIGLLF